jgi:hypothetical protein
MQSRCVFAREDPARLAFSLAISLKTQAQGSSSRVRVVHLSEVRARSRLQAYQQAIGGVLASNRRTLDHLHGSGALFSRAGVRAGRDLLLAHQNLLDMVAVLQRLTERSTRGRASLSRSEDAYRALDRLLARTAALAARTDTTLGKLAGDRG